MVSQSRLPPGQRQVSQLEVLHMGSIPRFDTAEWDFRVFGMVEKPLQLTWEEFRGLPQTTVTADFHCVTGWTRFDCQWRGVAFKTIAEMVRPRAGAAYVMVHADNDYTTNVRLDDLMADDVVLAMELDGHPLKPHYGGPLRLVVPKKYAYKSAKWLQGIELMSEDKPGFWESRGYSGSADPWTEDRFSR